MADDSDVVVISCLSSDEEEGGGATDNDDGSQKENVENAGGLKDDDDDEIEMVDKADAAKTATTAAEANADGEGENDEELQVVGTANEQKFPHSRQDCLEFRYDSKCGNDGNGDNGNARFCGLCYCYVCDRPAGECEDWIWGGKGVCTAAASDNGNASGDANGNAKSSGNDKEPHKNHCNATDKGPSAQLWKNMRQAVKEGRDPSQVSNRESPGRSSLEAWDRMIANYSTGHAVPRAGGGGGRTGARSPARMAVQAISLARTAARAAAGRARHRMAASAARGGTRQRRSHGAGEASMPASGMNGSTVRVAAWGSNSRSIVAGAIFLAAIVFVAAAVFGVAVFLAAASTGVVTVLFAVFAEAVVRSWSARRTNSTGNRST